MKYIRQFGIILAVTFIGEIINHIIDLPIPASIYGLILMFICLYTKIIRVESVRKTAYFLIEIMPMMFIPSAVGLLDSWTVLQPIWFPFCLIAVATTFIVMIIAGHMTQLVNHVENHFFEHEEVGDADTE